MVEADYFCPFCGFVPIVPPKLPSCAEQRETCKELESETLKHCRKMQAARGHGMCLTETADVLVGISAAAATALVLGGDFHSVQEPSVSPPCLAPHYTFA